MIKSEWEGELKNAYGVTLSALLSQGFGIMDAEDAVGAAVSAALASWPTSPPTHPAAWLYTVAYRRALDQAKARRRQIPLAEVEDLPDPVPFNLDSHIPDERLRLFFLCTHPAIDRSVQTPLMLQLVLGMSVESLSDLYLVPAATLSQRLVRAKKKIKSAQIEPRLPNPEEVSSRVTTVLEALYGLYFSEWRHEPSVTEALDLALILASLLPDDPEALGLGALIGFCHARGGARIDVSGALIPLEDQDQSHWDQAWIDKSELLLSAAARFRQPGRFQLEAAIQSAHLGRLATGEPGWDVIVRLYDQLIEFAPTAGFVLGRISALGKLGGPQIALSQLDHFEKSHPEIATSFQPYAASRAFWLAEIGDTAEATKAALTAWQQAATPAERKFLEAKYGLIPASG